MLSSASGPPARTSEPPNQPQREEGAALIGETAAGARDEAAETDVPAATDTHLTAKPSAAVRDTPQTDMPDTDVTPAPDSTPSRADSRQLRSTPARPKTLARRRPPEDANARDNAPRTLRLDQAIANQLRAAWLEARRSGELLLSQQAHAGRVLTRGLAGAAHPPAVPAMAPTDGSDSDGANAPVTLRLDQAVANQLRSAWMDARQSGEVLVSHKVYAGRVVTRGLAAEERARRR
jgi:hypothetical protein